MIKKIFTCLIVWLGLSSRKTGDPIKPSLSGGESLIEFAGEISGQNAGVLRQIQLFINDQKEYFLKYEDDLYQRGVESIDELTREIVLIDALMAKNKIVYVDHNYEGDLALDELDQLSNGELSAVSCFHELKEKYKAHGGHNTIGNFMHSDKLAPMPYECIESAGYFLAQINEDSDSYPLILVQQDKRNQLTEFAKNAEINLQFFER